MLTEIISSRWNLSEGKNSRRYYGALDGCLPTKLFKSPGQLARELGYAAPADFAYTFYPDIDYYKYLAQQNLVNPWDVLRHSQPSLIRFWYRQSPKALLPLSTQFVNMWDPPNVIPGMVRISLDTEGKLAYLDAVPEQLSGSPSPATTGIRTEDSPEIRDAPFTILFRSARLDLGKFQPAESEWTPPHAYDVRQAWIGVYPNLQQVPIRIEAALYRGRPVYFEIVSPWSKPLSEFSDSESIAQKVGTWILLGLFFGTMIIAALLALRNLRQGRGDRRGAFRVALFLFVLRMVNWLFSTHHVAAAEELVLLTTGLQSALFWSCFTGLLYLALEPYLRRRWPQRIISWNRLLAGDFRDPMVGRDILIGAVFGAGGILLMYFRILLPRWTSVNPGMPDVNDGLATSMVGISAFTRMFHLWIFFPITMDFTAWYATVFVVDLIFLLALAVYGFYTSLGGQSPFSLKLLAEE